MNSDTCEKGKVMLYLLHQSNHPDLAYTEGQGEIIHLESDLQSVIDSVNVTKRKWAFSATNGGAYYTQFYNDIRCLDQINWESVRAIDWSATEVKEGKQAEFLLYGSFPWKLVERIGVQEGTMRERVELALEWAEHIPIVSAQPDWYY